MVSSSCRRLSMRSRRRFSRSRTPVRSMASASRSATASIVAWSRLAERVLLVGREPGGAAHVAALADGADQLRPRFHVARARRRVGAADAVAGDLHPAVGARRCSCVNDSARSSRSTCSSSNGMTVAQPHGQTAHDVGQVRGLHDESGHRGQHGRGIRMGHDVARRQYNPWPVTDPAYRLAAGVSWIDLRFPRSPSSDRRGTRCTARRAPRSSIPGPTSCLQTLEDGLERARHAAARGLASPAHAHPPGSRGRRRHDRAAPSRTSASSCTTRARATSSIRRSCSRAPRGSTAPTWIGCGVRASRCRSGSCRSCDGGEVLEAAGRSVRA